MILDADLSLDGNSTFRRKYMDAHARKLLTMQIVLMTLTAGRRPFNPVTTTMRLPPTGYFSIHRCVNGMAWAS